MNIADVVWVGLAGGAGAVGRFVLDSAVRTRTVTRLPVGTVTINLSGSLLLGFVTGLVIYHGAPSGLTLVVGTGFCGGYTTFSTASFETVRLAQQGATRAAVVNLAGTAAGALAAGAAGLALAAR